MLVKIAERKYILNNGIMSCSCAFSYNNQWIVVDYKKFTPKKPLQDGALWILEQIPGYGRRNKSY